MIVIDAEQLGKAKITKTLIILNICFFAVFNVILASYPSIMERLMLYNYGVFRGEFWRLFTSLFLHADIMHLASNMFGLFIFGAALENIVGRNRLLVTYFIGGLLGNIMTVLLMPSFTYSLGASGAIYSLMGAVFVIIADENPFIFVYGLIYIIMAVYQSFLPGIGTWAHIFGLISGLILGYIWRMDIRKRAVDGYYKFVGDEEEDDLYFY